MHQSGLCHSFFCLHSYTGAIKWNKSDRKQDKLGILVSLDCIDLSATRQIQLCARDAIIRALLVKIIFLRARLLMLIELKEEGELFDNQSLRLIWLT